MNLAQVLSKAEKRPTRKRCGRGRGSGLGKTSGRGQKGAASRSGWRRRYGYDGGQTSLIRRLPKRGFTNFPFRQKHDVINLDVLEAGYQEGETVNLQSLSERGLLNPCHGRLKVLGGGDLKKKLTVIAFAVSGSARQKIEGAGGRVETLGKPKKKKFVPRPAPEPQTAPEKSKEKGAQKGKAKGGEEGAGESQAAAQASVDKGGAKKKSKAGEGAEGSSS